MWSSPGSFWSARSNLKNDTWGPATSGSSIEGNMLLRALSTPLMLFDRKLLLLKIFVFLKVQLQSSAILRLIGPTLDFLLSCKMCSDGAQNWCPLYTHLFAQCPQWSLSILSPEKFGWPNAQWAVTTLNLSKKFDIILIDPPGQANNFVLQLSKRGYVY